MLENKDAYADSKQSLLIIEGGNRIEGEIKVQGAKNSSLPVLAAAFLCGGQSVIHNCPALSDTYAACRILGSLGCKCAREDESVTVDSSEAIGYTVSEALMREMRSSIVFLGAVLGRTGRCRLSFPGGCELGPRPIDIHLEALKRLGVKIIEDHGVLDCTSGTRPVHADITLSLPSVGARRNGDIQRRPRAGDNRPCKLFKFLRRGYKGNGQLDGYDKRS